MLNIFKVRFELFKTRFMVERVNRSLGWWKCCCTVDEREKNISGYLSLLKKNHSLSIYKFPLWTFSISIWIESEVWRTLLLHGTKLTFLILTCRKWLTPGRCECPLISKLTPLLMKKFANLEKKGWLTDVSWTTGNTKVNALFWKLYKNKTCTTITISIKWFKSINTNTNFDNNNTRKIKQSVCRSTLIVATIGGISMHQRAGLERLVKIKSGLDRW